MKGFPKEGAEILSRGQAERDQRDHKATGAARPYKMAIRTRGEAGQQKALSANTHAICEKEVSNR
jgi:hypothetical protein